MPASSDIIPRICALKTGLVGTGQGQHERPHKPLLILAAIQMIDDGDATPDRVPWGPELRNHFTHLFDIVRSHDDRGTPENPFFYLASDGFWEPRRLQADLDREVALDRTPLIRDDGSTFGRFTDGLDIFLGQPHNRDILREALVARYFPDKADSLLLQFQPQDLAPEKGRRDDASEVHRIAETELESYGRSSAFRQTIIKLYDHQCAACGQRIRLPCSNASFVDAAHLIPFSESRNDHPTNGIALCKNHHWAMDRQLIAPTPEHTWTVSPILDARRSNGEASLTALEGTTLLLPAKAAYYPAELSLRWRLKRLVA